MHTVAEGKYKSITLLYGKVTITSYYKFYNIKFTTYFISGFPYKDKKYSK